MSDNLPESWHFPVDSWMGDLSWSPDGTEILLESFTYRVPLDGSPVVDSPFVNIPMDAAWSPDGSKMAIWADRYFSWADNRIDETLVYVVERDGTNLRPLVEDVGPYYENEVRLAE